MDYFVFPRIEIDGLNEEGKSFLDFDSFRDELFKKKRIILTGPRGCGKTTLLKYLFYKLVEEKCVIYCDMNSIKRKSSSRIIKSNFEDIYGQSPSDYIRFQQQPSSNKVLIIDDIDQINSRDLQDYINAVSLTFDFIILASNNIFDLDVFERMRAEINADGSMHKYRIMPFYYDKRKELVSKIVAARNNTCEDSVRIIEQLCDSLEKQKRFLNLTPSFIISFVEYFVITSELPPTATHPFLAKYLKQILRILYCLFRQAHLLQTKYLNCYQKLHTISILKSSTLFLNHKYLM